ncbi:MAG: enoyl-CoA hydratase/isomerase family protein [Actinomycetota bacterium]|nr:enoyl-CoA hydratase/isomerase family protein [Actinomycetota bacterium]
MIMLEKRESVFIATLDRDENVIDPPFVERFDAVLDEVEAASGRRTLVTTGTGRFFSTGLSLRYVETLDAGALQVFLTTVDHLLARLVSAPFVTVAAINGHCIAAGALLALAHDYRVMRADRGFFALPSVDVGIPFTHGMTALISRKVPPPWSDDLAISGDRFGGREASSRHVVHRAVPEDAVVPMAVEIAERHSGKDAGTLGTIKQRLYHDVLTALQS